MSKPRDHAPEAPPSDAMWTDARFPSAGMREEFLDQVRLWNRIDDLPKIQARSAANGRDLTYWCADYRSVGLRKLVDACGGTIVHRAGSAAAFDPEAISSAFDWAPRTAG